MKKINFIIITWNSMKYISKCIDSIKKIAIDYVIYVFDNGSTDGTFEYLTDESDEKLIIIKSETNVGTTISRNTLLKTMRESDYVCVLDSDTEINDYVGLDKALDFLEQNKDVGILGPKLTDSTGNLQFSARNIPSKKEKIYKILPISAFRRKALKLEHRNYDEIDGNFVVGYVMSACMILRYDNLKKIGYFDEKIFYAPEDVEYCVRSWDKGLKVIYFRDFSVLHHWQRLSRKKFLSKLNFEHLKGLRYFYHKYKNLKEIRKVIESYEKN